MSDEDQEERYLIHYGTPRHSGRYPWGSGENPCQRNGNFLSRYSDLHEQGIADKDIAKAMGMSLNDLRSQRQLAKVEQKASDISTARRLKDSGMSITAISRQMEKNESSIRSLLNPSNKMRNDRLITTRDMLKDQIEKKKYLDVGKGVEYDVGVSKQMLDNAVNTLTHEGYQVINLQVTQRGTGLKTTRKVLCPEGTTLQDVRDHQADIGLINERWSDDTQSYSSLGLKPIKSISSKRVAIRYGDEGGTDRDGVIELRRGVAGLDLGDSRYAQVRIGVDGTHYLKGMAIYSDNVPKGYDILFNTNKASGTPKKDVLKSMETNKDGSINKDNPFKTSLKLDESLHPVQKGYLNVVREEGDWGKWKKTLASQMLAKQPQELINKQLNLTYSSKRSELDEIKALTNPAVKKKLLMSFADGCDSDADHLSAAAMPRQATKVLLPLTDIASNKIYAPDYRDGESVVLIRYPHGGKFEIPELTVDNHSSKEAKSIFKGGGQLKDAVGINTDVAARLSGADFDGDTVLVIPNSRKEIKSSSPLKGLKDFNPSEAYPGYEGMKVLSDKQKGNEMGKVTNLITDMTLKGASDEELTRAVKHSMVVIDAHKHKLNYKQSEKDNGIKELKEKYQGHYDEDGKFKTGASTVISRAKAETRVPKRRMNYKINPTTGEKEWMYTGDKKAIVKVDKNTGEKKVVKYEPVLMVSTQMAETKDANTLSSGTDPEKAYAKHANKLKALANEARLTAVNTKPMAWSSSAKKTYSAEVESLDAKLANAKRKAPLERKAQSIANQQVSIARQDNPDMEKEDLKKVGTQALTAARANLGMKKVDVDITPKEWEAIQAGAISDHKLSEILTRADLDVVKAYATPRNKKTLTAAKKAQIKAAYSRGFTQREIADMFGISPSTVNEIV